jgi:hypothetical protein
VSLTKLKILEFIHSRHFVYVASISTGVYVFAWATRWSFDPFSTGTFAPGRFFTAQADSILHGHLWVQKSDLPIECYYHAGRCFGYYGIFPSLLRIPFLLILGPTVHESTAVFLSIAAGISFWAAVDLCRRIVLATCPNFSTTSAFFMVVSALALGPGSVLVLLSDPYLYQEAIMWSIAATLLGVNFIWRWWHERRQWQSIASMLAFICAGLSRPNYAFIPLTIVLGILLVPELRKRHNRRALLKALMLGALPIVATFGILFLKFGQVTLPQSSETYEAARVNEDFRHVVEVNNGVTVGLRFAPTAMWAYFRPDSLDISSHWPWVRFRFNRGPDSTSTRITYLPPLRKDTMWVERITSVPDAMPLAFLSTAGIVILLVRRRQHIKLILLAALCTPLLITSMHVAISARFLGDAYPLLAAGMAFTASLIPLFDSLNKQNRQAIASTVVLVSLFSVLAVPMLTTQNSWIYIWGIK